ncbi:MAG TPA: response regulator [Waterburya sp.]
MLEIARTTKRILLVDDEAHVREVVEACLIDLGGWDVYSVASVQQGLDRLVTMQPDAIILDLAIPGLDGFAFLQKQRANPVTRSIPVVLLTARAGWFTLKQLQPFGVVGVIAKPFNPVLLTTKIAKILGWSLAKSN